MQDPKEQSVGFRLVMLVVVYEYQRAMIRLWSLRLKASLSREDAESILLAILVQALGIKFLVRVQKCQLPLSKTVLQNE